MVEQEQWAGLIIGSRPLCAYYSDPDLMARPDHLCQSAQTKPKAAPQCTKPAKAMPQAPLRLGVRQICREGPLAPPPRESRYVNERKSISF